MLLVAAQQQPRGASQWLVAAFLYVSYNIVAGMPFLVIMGGQASSRRNALWGGVLGGVLGILMLLIGAAMYLRIDTLGGVSMPMLALATQISPGLGHLMSLAIFGMILNTAVGMLYAFVARILPAGGTPFRLGTTVAGIAALAGSFVGFIKLVGVVYPIYGYIGFLLMGCTLVCWLRSAAARHRIAGRGLVRLTGPGKPAGHTVFDTHPRAERVSSWRTRSHSHRIQPTKERKMLRPGITLDNFVERQRGTLPDTYGVRLLALSEGRMSMEMTVAPWMMAPNGYLHAASLVMLADTCAGYATMAHLPEGAKGFTTLELKSNFLGTAREGVLSVEAIADHMGRSTQIWSANVVDATGRKLALFRCSQVILW